MGLSPSSSGIGSSERSLRTALGVLACAVTALVDQGALDHPFVFDDRTTVLLNPSLVDLQNVRGLLLDDLPRTVVNLSYAVDRAFWGFSSFGFHVTNFVLHVVVVGLFYGLCTRALEDGVTRRRRSEAASAGQARLRPGGTTARQGPGVEWPAFFAAATFALHPLMGASAAYVSARSEILCALGVLAALTYARRAIVASSAPAGVVAAAFGTLALGSSGAAAGLPVLVLAYDSWVLRDPRWKRRLWRVYLPAMSAVALVAAWNLRAVLASPRVPPRGLVNNLLTEAVVIWRYAGLLLVPAGQALVHQVHWVTTSVDPIGVLALGGLAAGLVAAVRVRHAAPVAAFGLLWFFAALLPTSLVPLRDAMAEPRAYLASAGLVLAAASMLAQPLATRRAARAAAVGVLVILTVLTHVRNTVWADPVRLWEESVRRSPEAWQGHVGYAESLREIGQCTRAIPEYEMTLRLNPGQQDAAAGLRACRR